MADDAASADTRKSMSGTVVRGVVETEEQLEHVRLLEDSNKGDDNNDNGNSNNDDGMQLIDEIESDMKNDIQKIIRRMSNEGGIDEDEVIVTLTPSKDLGKTASSPTKMKKMRAASGTAGNGGGSGGAQDSSPMRALAPPPATSNEDGNNNKKKTTTSTEPTASAPAKKDAASDNQQSQVPSVTKEAPLDAHAQNNNRDASAAAAAIVTATSTSDPSPPATETVLAASAKQSHTNGNGNINSNSNSNAHTEQNQKAKPITDASMDKMEQGVPEAPAAVAKSPDDKDATANGDAKLKFTKSARSARPIGSASRSTLRSTKRSALESSALKFQNIEFIVGKTPKQKQILSNVSGKVKDGHVLAIMGPSGAGKTTLISVLTLDALYGTPYGKVTLNGIPVTGDIFKTHCFVVKQQDKHWPYLTTREALQYSAGLFDIATPENIPILVDELIEKMGLTICADTMCARLSGGQKRRLSIAVALLKQPTVLFLDEPTSGLDAASASNIMEEIARVAKEERLVIVCTIHQPSTKVYNGFDQVMILSRGREAFSGDVGDASPYFGSIGHPLPPATNPAEHFLDLVNSDFSGEEQVNSILDQWERQKGPSGLVQSSHGGSTKDDGDDDDPKGIDTFQGTSISQQLGIMFKRHLTLIVRDPILYLGRCAIFFIASTIFSFVYWSARETEADQLFSKMWIQVWFTAVPANMGVVAVYALNDEFKSIQRETQNGMSSPIAYIMAKTILVLPIFFIFACSALLIPSFVIQAVPFSAFFECLMLYVSVMFVFESVAEALSVAFSDPILGMLQFMNFWFGSFLFGGFLIGENDLYWPLKLFFYVMPFSYYVRSVMYVIMQALDWEEGSGFTSSAEALGALNNVFPVIENENTVWQDVFTMLGIGLFYKILYIVLVLTTTSKVANVKKNV